jgi:hypothetical protein
MTNPAAAWAEQHPMFLFGTNQLTMQHKIRAAAGGNTDPGVDGVCRYRSNRP